MPLSKALSQSESRKRKNQDPNSPSEKRRTVSSSGSPQATVPSESLEFNKRRQGQASVAADEAPDKAVLAIVLEALEASHPVAFKSIEPLLSNKTPSFPTISWSQLNERAKGYNLSETQPRDLDHFVGIIPRIPIQHCHLPSTISEKILGQVWDTLTALGGVGNQKKEAASVSIFSSFFSPIIALFSGAIVTCPDQRVVLGEDIPPSTSNGFATQKTVSVLDNVSVVLVELKLKQEGTLGLAQLLAEMLETSRRSKDTLGFSTPISGILTDGWRFLILQLDKQQFCIQADLSVTGDSHLDYCHALLPVIDTIFTVLLCSLENSINMVLNVSQKRTDKSKMTSSTYVQTIGIPPNAGTTTSLLRSRESSKGWMLAATTIKTVRAALERRYSGLAVTDSAYITAVDQLRLMVQELRRLRLISSDHFSHWSCEQVPSELRTVVHRHLKQRGWEASRDLSIVSGLDPTSVTETDITHWCATWHLSHSVQEWLRNAGVKHTGFLWELRLDHENESCRPPLTIFLELRKAFSCSVYGLHHLCVDGEPILGSASIVEKDIRNLLPGHIDPMEVETREKLCASGIDRSLLNCLLTTQIKYAGLSAADVWRLRRAVDPLVHPDLTVTGDHQISSLPPVEPIMDWCAQCKLSHAASQWLSEHILTTADLPAISLQWCIALPQTQTTFNLGRLIELRWAFACWTGQPPNLSSITSRSNMTMDTILDPRVKPLFRDAHQELRKQGVTEPTLLWLLTQTQLEKCFPVVMRSLIGQARSRMIQNEDDKHLSIF